MSDDKIIAEAVELANEAKKPGVFSIINALKDRAFPTEEINVYLDEKAAYEAAKVQEKIDELSRSASEEDLNKSDKLSLERDAIISKMEESKYVFSITGISEGRRSEIQDKCLEKFPMEYDEAKNPFTGEITKQEKEDKHRDRYFTNLLWVDSITKIVAPDGSEQDSISLEDVESLRSMLPLAASGSINQSIEKLRVSTAVFMASVDEDFLAKS